MHSPFIFEKGIFMKLITYNDSPRKWINPDHIVAVNETADDMVVLLTNGKHTYIPKDIWYERFVVDKDAMS